jgi:hypothetical protein
MVKELVEEQLIEELAEELAKGSVEWFKSKIGLFVEGLDIKRELNESHVSMEECECLWGMRVKA